MLGFDKFLLEEDAVGVVELILILVVLISLVMIFKKQLTNLVNSIFKTITKEAGKRKPDCFCSTQYDACCCRDFYASGRGKKH